MFKSGILIDTAMISSSTESDESEIESTGMKIPVNRRKSINCVLFAREKTLVR